MFDAKKRVIIEDYTNKPTFASFLPGISGMMGTPIWCFYVNRGQGISSFGVRDKDHCIMEFHAAQQAYQNVSTVGFRTFIKVDGSYYEAFGLEALKEENFIAYKGTSQDETISYEEIMGYTPRIIAEPNEGSILAGLVAAGAGIAIILNTPIINTNKISVVKIKDDLDYKKIYIGWNKHVLLSEHQNLFKEYVLKLGRENDILGNKNIN